MEVFPGLEAFFWKDFQINNCNCYLIAGSSRILIDPGHARLVSHVRAGLTEKGFSPDDIDVVIVTHAHPDHMEAAVLEFPRADMTMSHREYDYFRKAAGAYAEAYVPAFFLKEGEVRIGDVALQIVSTPGHTPGSICIYWPDRKALFSGDLVFSRGVGRTDLPGGNTADLKKSIRKIAGLDLEYILPGHGEIVAGKKEIEANFRIIEQFSMF
ncbi:MAG TPA: MBL fold metallo-hydrolase [Syntrophales bacterium]|nr:MBL fold metallo-hydrolase [Syntrophales bacterium]